VAGLLRPPLSQRRPLKCTAINSEIGAKNDDSCRIDSSKLVPKLTTVVAFHAPKLVPKTTTVVALIHPNWCRT